MIHALPILNTRLLYWLASALFAALLPLLNSIPPWLAVLFILLFSWRIQYARKKTKAFKKIAKLSLVTISVALLLISVDKLFSVQGFVSLLSLTCCLKLLELESRRDYLLLMFLGCFISACQLLFSSSLASFSYSIFCLILFHSALLFLDSVSLPGAAMVPTSRWQSVKMYMAVYRKMALLFLQALPIAIVLFIVMPRIGSLWQVPLNTDVAKSGVSDSLTAGDIAKLNRDHSPAMRVTFQSEGMLDNADMYWRGVILSEFDGLTWRRSSKPLRRLDETKKARLHRQLSKAKEQTVSYQIMLERTGRPWLYALNTGLINAAGVTQWSNYQFTRATPVLSRYQYSVKSAFDYIDIEPLSAQAYQLNTSLGTRFKKALHRQNPLTREYAAQLVVKYSHPEQRINALLKKYSGDFIYTLAPGKSNLEHPIDDFLFSKKRGYCEHFASSTAYVLRAAGIPARVVVGYQGGQYSADQSYLLITQTEAHAWVEVWLEKKGWVTLDPTAAVAPQRIEQGATYFLPQLFSRQNLLGQFGQFSLIRKMRLSWDNVNYKWHKWVLNYDNTLQLSFVSDLLGGVDAWRIVLLILSSIMLVLLPMLAKLYLFSNKCSKDPLMLSVIQLHKKLAKSNIHRAKGESLAQLLERASQHSDLNRTLLSAIENQTTDLLYAGSKKNSEAGLNGLNKLIAKL